MERMAKRVLVCIEDTPVAHVVTARLSADGVDGVVVEHARDLVDMAQKGVDAIALQDRYQSGEIGASLLRQVRLKNENVAVPAIVVVTEELQPPDRHVLEKQYRVHAFLEKSASPHQIVEGLLGAAGPMSEEEAPFEGDSSGFDDDDDVDIELHPDETKNAFEIDVAGDFDVDDENEIEEEEDPSAMTMEYKVPVEDLEAMREMPPPLPPDAADADKTQVHAALPRNGPVDSQEDTGEIDLRSMSMPMPTGDAANTLVIDVPSELPLPGGDYDFSLPSGPAHNDTQMGDAEDLSMDLSVEVRAERPLDETTPAPPPGLSSKSHPPVGEDGNAEETAPGRVSPSETSTATKLDDNQENAAGTDDEQDANASSSDVDSDDVLDLIEKVDESGSHATIDADVSASLDVDTPDAGAENSLESSLSSEEAEVDAASSEPPDSNSRSEGDAMQMNELKKALLASKRKLETANKRIEELEDNLTRARGPAMAGADEGLPDEGVFEELRYPLLLSRCRFEAFTGSIEMPTEGATRTVFIRDGLPVGYQSSEPGERIGKQLVSQGRISDDDYVKAATRMVERGIKLTDALVELGLIEAEALSIELRNLTKDQIITGFGLTQGNFSLQKDVTPDDSVPTFDFGPGEIYVQGYRQYAPKVEMQALFEQLRNKYLIANARLASFRPKLGLGGDDERLLRLLGEAYTLEEAVERADVGEEDAARLVASLQVLDLVEEWSPGVEQFQARLRTERQRFAEELAKIQDEASRREARLFEGFERALAKITSTVGGKSVALAEHVEASTGALPPKSEKDVAPPAPVPEKKVDPPATPPPAAPAAEPPPDEPMEPVSSDDAKMPAAPGPDEPLSPGDQKYREGVQLAADNRLDEAEATLREAVRLDPAKSTYLTSLARVLLSNPRYERAGTLPVVRSLLDRAVQLSPTDAEAKELHEQVIKEMD